MGARASRVSFSSCDRSSGDDVPAHRGERATLMRMSSSLLGAIAPGITSASAASAAGRPSGLRGSQSVGSAPRPSGGSGTTSPGLVHVLDQLLAKRDVAGVWRRLTSSPSAEAAVVLAASSVGPRCAPTREATNVFADIVGAHPAHRRRLATAVCRPGWPLLKPEAALRYNGYACERPLRMCFRLMDPRHEIVAGSSLNQRGRPWPPPRSLGLSQPWRTQ
jgi:hypothetical protein